MEDKIVSLLHQQQAQAITLLYDNYGSSLYGIVLKVVRSRELAEQVLQDTFLKAWQHGTKYDAQKGRLFTWLLNIARNTAIDATRTQQYKFYQKVETDEVLKVVPGQNSVNPDTVGVRQLVDNMDEKYRVLIEKIYFEGYTQQEIEQEMGIPAGTIKTRLRYAINELRTVFSDTNAGSLSALLLILERFYVSL